MWYDISFRYVKNNGEVLVQKGLSRERPSYRAIRVKSKAKILQIVCQDNVVWAVTEARRILVRLWVTSGTDEGADWTPLSG